MQQSLVLIKPDGVVKGLTPEEIIQDTDLKIVSKIQFIPSLEQAQEHYAEHNGKNFYERICTHLSSGPVIALIIEGPDSIKRVRARMGKVDDPKTLRGKYHTPGLIQANAIHGSDSVESAQREIKLWFG